MNVFSKNSAFQSGNLDLLGINGRQDIPKYPMYFNGTLIFLHTTMISLRYIVAFLNIGWDVVVVVVIVLLNYRIDVFCHMKRSSVIRFRSFRSEIHQLTEKYRVVVVSVGDCFVLCIFALGWVRPKRIFFFLHLQIPCSHIDYWWKFKKWFLSFLRKLEKIFFFSDIICCCFSFLFCFTFKARGTNYRRIRVENGWN